MENEAKWYSSSLDPAKVSLTLKGLALGLVPVILFLAGYFGLDIVETDLVDLIEKGTAAVAAAVVFWGLIRKFFKREA